MAANNTVPPQPIAHDELAKYQVLLNPMSQEGAGTQPSSSHQHEELSLAPLIWWDAKQELSQDLQTDLKQYAVLGKVLNNTSPDTVCKPVLLNTNAPWSAFLCGSQGSGKSHALSCMLENCLIVDEQIGRNPKPLAGLVFHYDSTQGSGVCEAAYLCTKIPTTILVSPSRYAIMKGHYEKMAARYGGRINVEKLRLLSQHLNTERIKTLMAVGKEDDIPLYMQVLFRILREMAVETDGSDHFNYRTFKDRLQDTKFMGGQNAGLTMRIELLESFLDPSITAIRKGKKPAFAVKDFLIGQPGTLTIIDLTDPLIDADGACVLFNICLSIFISQTKCSKIVALDEAHNYMGESSNAAGDFTNKLLKTIREQRHVGTRVVVATQEPSVNEKLLDLCSITMVHRCTSPAWYAVLKRHIAALYLEGNDASRDENRNRTGDKDVLQEIVQLKLGECLLFCPTAAIGVQGGSLVRLAQGRVRFKTRERLTADGGNTKLAIDS